MKPKGKSIGKPSFPGFIKPTTGKPADVGIGKNPVRSKPIPPKNLPSKGL